MTRNVSVELVIASGPVCQSSVLVQHLIWVGTVISEHELFLVLFNGGCVSFCMTHFFSLNHLSNVPSTCPEEVTSFCGYFSRND